MAEPSLDLDQAKRLLAALYEPGDTFYVLAYEDRKKGGRKERRFQFDDAWPVGTFISATNERRWAVATSVGVFEPARTGQRPRRTEDQCVGLSAFGIDIDGKNLAALVPGATTVEEVVSEVVQRLEKAGIPPHALVRSGHGLHVYILIERVTFADDEARTRAKDTWYRLTQLLGGAADRFDLSSVLRLPGTLNRKGEPVRVEFVDEHTHLDRAHHTLEKVARAVEHLPALTADKAVGKKRKRSEKKDRQVLLGAGALEQDAWDLHVLGVALKLDPKLAEDRLVSMEGRASKTGKLDRSGNDFRYACRLLELGVPAGVVRAELATTARGRTETEAWLDSTFLAATARVYPTKDGEKSIAWNTTKSGGEALFTGVEEPARLIQRQALDTYSRGEVPALASLEPPPIVAVALARPGKGKTRGILNWLSSARGIGTGRLGLCGSMVRELLRYEYIVNAAFPEGLEFVFNGVEYQFEADLPGDHETLWKRLPEKMKQRIDPTLAVDGDGGFQRLWSLEKLKAVVADTAAFYVNSRHPDEVDRGMEPYEDESGPVLPAWAESWDDPVLRQPRAVLKFRGTPDLCLANRSAKDLRNRRTCLEWCDFSACRANANIKVGGAKTYWTDAPFALLSHKAYETHAVVKPSLNKFDSIVFDELPPLVYRYPKLRMRPAKVKNGRALGWDVQPVENVVKSVAAHLASLDPNHPDTGALRAAVEPVLQKLEAAGKRLAKKASDLMHKTVGGKLQRGMVQVDRLEPLATLDDFAALVKAGNIEVDEDGDAEAPDADPSLTLLNDLSVLQDFCGDADLDVFMESDFDQDGEGSLRVCRPVNGWPDLLNGPDGRPRPTVLLDASAGIDPRYLLAGRWEVEEVPEGEFPNTTIVVTSEKYVSKKRVTALGAPELAALLVRQVTPHLGDMADPSYPHRAAGPPRLLVITAMALEDSLQQALTPFVESGKLPAKVAVDHFGGLRGRNDYRDFDAVYLTHAHLYDDGYYTGLELLLRDFGKPFDRQWVPKAKWHRLRSKQLQHRAQTADIYQDALRIGIRSDPERRAFIFVPTPEAGFVVRLLRMFRGARLMLPNGGVVLSPALPPRTRKESKQPAQNRVDSTA